MPVLVLVLTSDNGCDEPDGFNGRLTPRPAGLQDILGEGEGGDRVPGGHDHKQSHPQVQERRQGTERLVDVRVIATRFRNHCTCKYKQTQSIHLIIHGCPTFWLTPPHLNKKTTNVSGRG